MSQFKQDKAKLGEMLQEINEGKLKLPSFQRDYKWKPSQVKKLLDSIQKQHPAGSLLLLEVNRDNQLISHEKFKYTSASIDLIVPENLTLDGQQRLTSCYCVFYNKGTSTYYIDLQKLFLSISLQNSKTIDFEDVIIRRPRASYPDQFLFSHHIMPLSFLQSKDIMREKLVSYKETIRNEHSNKDYVIFIESKLESLLDPFFDYVFPVITLPKSLNLDAVCKVFQTINTTGLRLSAFDICVARFMALNINLKTKLKDCCSTYTNLSVIVQQDETIILQTVALLSNKSPKKNSLPDSLDELDINCNWDKAAHGLSTALDLLTRIGAGCDKNLSLVPYQPTIPVIGAILADVDYINKPIHEKGNVEDKITKWFYAVALRLRYTEGTDNKMKEDFSNLRKWMSNNSQKPDYMSEPIRWNPTKIVQSNKNGAIGKAILCLLNREKPYDLYTNNQVGIGALIVESQLHHLFPYAKYAQQYNDLLHSVFNFTFLTTDSNRYISNKRTNEYILGILEHRNMEEVNLRGLLKKHFINDVSFEDLKSQNFIEFLDHRMETVRNTFNSNFSLNIIIDTEAQELDDEDDDFDLTNEQNDNISPM